MESQMQSDSLRLKQRREDEVAELIQKAGTQERYESVADYDPVLLWHCRLLEKPKVLPDSGKA